jgi:hypothetical protein
MDGRACNQSAGGAEVFAEARSLHSCVQCNSSTVSHRAHKANVRESICNVSVQIRRQRQEAAQSSRRALCGACRSAPGDAMAHAAHIVLPPSALHHVHIAFCHLDRPVLSFCGQSVFDSALFVEKYPRAEIRISIHVMQVFSHSFSSLRHQFSPCSTLHILPLRSPATLHPISHPMWCRTSSRLRQIDGSVRCACINAASMALIAAGVEMRDTVCACSAGILDSTIVVDLTQSEENA